MSDVEIADLEELVGCKGWQWLRDTVGNEFGADGLVEQVRQISASTDSPEMKQARIDRAFAAQNAMLGILQMPQREIQKRREAFKHRPDELAGQRRRGETL